MTFLPKVDSALFMREDLALQARATVVVNSLVGVQADPSRKAQELVEKPRSNKVEEREDGVRKLRDMGRIPSARIPRNC